ncbi:MAG: YceK/YidQ family lipoprotein [Betaproteobacteria bacterium]|nr:MAG: YceK/YidQ family lipoprotein [Acidobacteriota bacterium]TMH80365.1 MAG: YceK/YidQ family lipoprotein [Betaproteobacteria bacterium]
MKIARCVSIVPAVVLLLSSSGCATYRTISKAEQGSPKVFSGTRLDVSAILGDESALRKFKADPPRYPLVDLPFSIGFDMAILGLTLPVATGELLSK